MDEKNNNFQLSREDFKKISPDDFVAQIDATEKKTTIAHLSANVKWIDNICAKKAYQKVRFCFGQDFKAGKLVYGNLNEEFREKAEKLAKLMMANFGLTKQEFLTINADKFVEHIYHYQKKRTIDYLVKKGIPPNIAEDAFWEAVFYFRQRFVKNTLKYDNLSSLFNTNARQQAVKIINKKKQERAAEKDSNMNQQNDNSSEMDEEFFERIKKGLKQLCPKCNGEYIKEHSKCCKLIRGHYLNGKSWRELALEKKPTLFQKIERIIKGLYGKYKANIQPEEQSKNYSSIRGQYLNGEDWKIVADKLSDKEVKNLKKQTIATRKAGNRCMKKLRDFILGK